MIFDQPFFLLSSILLGGLLSEKSIFHIYGSFCRKCASTDLQSNNLPLKFPKTYHYEIFCYNLLMTPLLCVLLSEIVYYTCFGRKMSCLQINIAVLWWLVLRLLDIHQLIFYYVNLCMHAKVSMWTFYHDLVNLPLLWMDIP